MDKGRKVSMPKADFLKRCCTVFTRPKGGVIHYDSYEAAKHHTMHGGWSCTVLPSLVPKGHYIQICPTINGLFIPPRIFVPLGSYLLLSLFALRTQLQWSGTENGALDPRQIYIYTLPLTLALRSHHCFYSLQEAEYNAQLTDNTTARDKPYINTST